MATLLGSVGRGGLDRKPDVLLVQDRLNGSLGFLTPLAPLTQDGVAGLKTIGAIDEFQRRIVKMNPPDGRIDPGGKTWPILENAAKGILPAPGAVAGSGLAWGAKVSSEFRAKVIQICQRLGFNPDYLMAAMAFETGESFSPSIRNAAGSGAVGLIQFMPRTAAGLGTDTAALAKMSAVEQLDYVEAHFKRLRVRPSTLEDVYMGILWPDAIGRSNEYVLFQSPSTAYGQNRGLDLNRDGKITKFEAATLVRAKLVKGRGLAG